jgi:hypothetical protein
VSRPYVLYAHGNSDTTGAIPGVEAIATRAEVKARPGPVTVMGSLGREDRELCWELGATTVANLMR